MPIQPDRGIRKGIAWREVLASFAPERSTPPPPMETLRLLKLHGRHESARSACDELIASDMLTTRDLLVLSDQCKTRGEFDDWEFYRRHAYEIEMFGLGLRENDLAESVQYCLASDGACAQLASPPECYVRAMFDRYSLSFDERLVGELDYRGPHEVYRIVSSHLATKLAAARILDIGCGTGLAGPLFRPRAIRLDGIDLSPAMIDRARERGVYDELTVGDIVKSLHKSPSNYDLVIAIDVLIYIGDLSPLFTAIQSVLCSGGLVAASIEQGDTGYQLANHRRYIHDLDYVREVSLAAGLKIVHVEETSLRKERGKPVNFYVVLFTTVSAHR